MMIFPSHCIRLQGWDSPHRWTEAESGVARFVVDGYVCGRVREFLSGDIKARSGDRAVNYPPFIPGVNVAEADSWDKKI